MTRRHTVGRVHEIEKEKTREPDAEQVRHEDRERDAAERGLRELRHDESRAATTIIFIVFIQHLAFISKIHCRRDDMPSVPSTGYDFVN